MAYVVLDHTAPQRSHPQRLKQDLVSSLNTALAMQREMGEMTDLQLEEQYGVPTAAVSAFRTNVTNAVAALESSAITNIISSMGFSA